MAPLAAVRRAQWRLAVNDHDNLKRPTSDLHTLGALVAGNLPPDAVPADQWPTITRLALQHGLAPMLHWTLKRAGCDLDANSAWQPLVQARYQTAIDWALKERAQLEIDAALRAAGIPAIWLKGSVLARTVYPEPSLRPMTDLDVLVPYEQRDIALEVVRSKGYDFYIQPGPLPRDSGDPLTRRYTHHYALHGGVTGNLRLELHHGLLGRYDPLPADKLNWFWGQQHVMHLEHGNTLCPLAPEAHLLYLAAHAVLQHGEAQLYLLRYFDVHQMVTQLPLTWGEVVEYAVALEWTFAVERALQYASDYFATPVPNEVLDELRRRRAAGEAEPLVARLQGPDQHWNVLQRQLARMSIPDRLRLLSQKMCPPRSYMRWRYHIPEAIPTWPYYLYRWFYWGIDLARTACKRIMQHR